MTQQIHFFGATAILMMFSGVATPFLRAQGFDARGTAAVVRLTNRMAAQVPAGWSSTVQEGTNILLPPGFVAGQGEAYFVRYRTDITSVYDRNVLGPTQSDEKFVVTRVHPQAAIRGYAGQGIAHRVDFVARATGERGMILAYTVPVGGAFATVGALGLAQKVGVRMVELEGIAATLRQEEAMMDHSPLARQWTQRLAGRRAQFLQGYNSNTSGGGGYSREEAYGFSAQGRYTYRYRSMVSLGAYGGSTESKDAAGQWRVYGRNGQAILELVSDRGEQEEIVLGVAGGRVTFDGRAVLLD